MEIEATKCINDIPTIGCSSITLEDLYWNQQDVISPIKQKNENNRIKDLNVRFLVGGNFYVFGNNSISSKIITMPAWQLKIKRLLDVIGVLVASVLLFPLFMILAIGVRISSKGPIIYSQERVGKFGKRFRIYKFRSMYSNAEPAGPQLSKLRDSRVTAFGFFMRKTHLDELPQFYNILRGEMSLVGPRPERLYYINRIIERNPHYLYLLNVRPGLTSWGQVKFGYAQNVDEMLVRLKFDMKYIQNMSLLVDLNILICTIKTLFKFNGI